METLIIQDIIMPKGCNFHKTEFAKDHDWVWICDQGNGIKVYRCRDCDTTVRVGTANDFGVVCYDFE